jgi:hypothetical protein
MVATHSHFIGQSACQQTLFGVRPVNRCFDFSRSEFRLAPEFGCPDDTAYALLLDAGHESRLPLKEVSRHIECGLMHGRGTTC